MRDTLTLNHHHPLFYLHTVYTVCIYTVYTVYHCLVHSRSASLDWFLPPSLQLHLPLISLSLSPPTPLLYSLHSTLLFSLTTLKLESSNT